MSCWRLVADYAVPANPPYVERWLAVNAMTGYFNRARRSQHVPDI